MFYRLGSCFVTGKTTDLTGSSGRHFKRAWLSDAKILDKNVVTSRILASPLWRRRSNISHVWSSSNLLSPKTTQRFNTPPQVPISCQASSKRRRGQKQTNARAKFKTAEFKNWAIQRRSLHECQWMSAWWLQVSAGALTITAGSSSSSCDYIGNIYVCVRLFSL